MSEGTMNLPELAPISAVEALTRGEIDIQIATAHRYPRAAKDCLDRARSLATLTPEVAAQMGYALPREGKVIRGPSIRLAEIIGSTWGNVRYGARVIEVGDRYVVAQGMCHDLESNVAIQQEVRRRITDKHGRRYSDDMIVVTSNAACAIALREAIFKVIPRVLAQQVYEDALKVAAGDMKSLVERRTRAMQWFAQTAGVQADRVLAVLGREAVDAITVDDLGTLQGLRQAIVDGETSVEEAFPVLPKFDVTQDAGKKQPTPEPPVGSEAKQGAPESKTEPAPGTRLGEERRPPPQAQERRRRSVKTGNNVTAGIQEATIAAIVPFKQDMVHGGPRIIQEYLDKLNLSNPDLSFLREEEGQELLALLRAAGQLKEEPAAPQQAAEEPDEYLGLTRGSLVETRLGGGEVLELRRATNDRGPIALVRIVDEGDRQGEEIPFYIREIMAQAKDDGKAQKGLFD